jgi:formylglycine-generating enzyme required for sulfatase activity
MFADQGNPNMPWATVMEKGTRPHTGSGDRLYMNVAANGIRLPLDVEFALANKQPSATEVNEEWNASNANDKTHGVGSKAAYANGLCDMNGNVFEWAWDSRKVNFEAQGASYNINGNGYFYESYEKTKPRSSAKPVSFSEYTSVARSFVGFRVVKADVK